MTQNEFFVKLFGSKESKAEFDHLEQWQQEGLDNASVLQELLEINEDAGELSTYKSFNVDDALARSMENIEEAPVKKSNFNKVLLSAIAIIALLFASIYFFKLKEVNNKIQIAESPGLMKVDNGSEITLNENSSYTYDAISNHLKLDGEAYFDVSKQEKPFVIETKHGTIKVLGTAFNVKTDTDHTSIFMFEGKVSFEHQEETFYLNQGEYALVNEIVKKSNEESQQVYSYWRTKKLAYKNVPLANVLDDVNRLFNSNLNVNSGNPEITSSFENNTLEEIINILETISGLEIQ